MPRAVSILLRCLGINRPKPKTAVGRCLRGSERALTVLGLAYLGLHLFPQVLFAHSLTVEGITVHSRTPLPEAAAGSIGKAAALLRESAVGAELGKEDVFICGSPGMLRLFNPRGSAVFGVSTPLTNHVYLAEADFATGTARRFGDDFNTRALSGLIAHELTHGLIRRRLGLIKGERLPTWIDEGYCEYVARDGSFPEDEGRRLFMSGEEDASPAYRYFVYRLLVQYLLDERHVGFSGLVDGSHDFDAIAGEVRAHLQRDHDG